MICLAEMLNKEAVSILTRNVCFLEIIFCKQILGLNNGSESRCFWPGAKPPALLSGNKQTGLRETGNLFYRTQALAFNLLFHPVPCDT